jgi:hypothetical protein
MIGFIGLWVEIRCKVLIKLKLFSKSSLSTSYGYFVKVNPVIRSTIRDGDLLLYTGCADPAFLASNEPVAIMLQRRLIGCKAKLLSGIDLLWRGVDSTRRTLFYCKTMVDH